MFVVLVEKRNDKLWNGGIHLLIARRKYKWFKLCVSNVLWIWLIPFHFYNSQVKSCCFAVCFFRQWASHTSSMWAKKHMHTPRTPSRREGWSTLYLLSILFEMRYIEIWIAFHAYNSIYIINYWSAPWHIYFVIPT